MAAGFTVVISDFLEEATVEAPVLEGLARIVLARASNEDELGAFLPDADAMIVYHDIAYLSNSTFAKASRCRCLVRAGVGYNNIDRVAAARRGIVVCNVPDYGTEEVADHAMMFLLALARYPSRRTRRSAPAVGIIGQRWERPGCAVKRWAWSAAGGSARRRPSAPRRSASTSSSSIRTFPRGRTRPWASAASIGSTTCSNRPISSVCTAISTTRRTT
jgi:lactate dehydrogenase-like 2-hydroxyacid dehydrogenase